MRDVTIGQFYPADSALHRLDPRVKLTGTLVYIVSLFVFRTWGYLLGTAFLLLVILLSKVPAGRLLKSLKPVWVLLLFMVLLNIFLTQGEIVWQWGILHITREGLMQAAKMALRLVYLVIGASIMTMTTTPTKLTDGLERLLRPLNRVHVPVHEIAMMMSIALRFIPILLEEADRIKDAQKARGADFASGSLVQRAKALMPLLVPLFVSAFRRAGDLAQAMEARCYTGGEGRTQMNPLQYRSRDTAAYVVLFAYLAAAIVLRAILGW